MVFSDFNLRSHNGPDSRLLGRDDPTAFILPTCYFIRIRTILSRPRSEGQTGRKHSQTIQLKPASINASGDSEKYLLCPSKRVTLCRDSAPATL